MGLHPIHCIILKPTQSQVCLCHHRLNHIISSLPQLKENLVECVRPGAPVGEEHAETNGFEDAGESADGDCVEGTLFGNDLRDDRRCRASHEDQGAHVCRTLVGQCAGSIEKSADAI